MHVFYYIYIAYFVHMILFNIFFVWNMYVYENLVYVGCIYSHFDAFISAKLMVKKEFQICDIHAGYFLFS